MSSANNSSFVEEQAYVHWMTINDDGKRVRESTMDKWLWNRIKNEFYKGLHMREDFTAFFHTTTHHAYSVEMANDAFRDLNKQRRSGIAMEREHDEQRARCQPGELKLPFAPCRMGDRTDPRCCMNNLEEPEGDSEPDSEMATIQEDDVVTSTPKPSSSRPAHFGGISEVRPNLKRPLHVHTTPARETVSLPTGLGSQASSRRTSFSSARSARADSMSSQEDGAPWLRRTPKRPNAQEPHSSSSRNRGTQVKRARRESEPGLVGIRSPATPGARSPDGPESGETDWNQPSTSGPQPPKVCKKRAKCSSRCTKGPCHEEMF